MSNLQLVFLMLAITFVFPVFADSKAKAIQIEGKSLGKFPFRVLGSAKYQNATFGSKDKSTVNARHLNGFGAEALAGLVLGPIFIGGGGEYMNWIQATGPKDNTDLTGNSVNVFGAVGFAFHRFLLVGKYIFQSTYRVNKKDALNNRVQYSGPEDSFAATLVYRFGKRSFFTLEYDSLTYGKQKLGSTSSTLGSDEKMKFSSVGFSYGVMF